ncbi:MAG TPA: ribonuclease R [Candidatus Binatia bacterium]|nr:ribonuclease R [Candidatus Binatia bacterium]
MRAPPADPETLPVPSEDEAALDTRLLAAVERRKAPVAGDDLLRAARVSRAERRSGKERLAALEARGLLVRTRGDRFTLPARVDMVAGRLHVNPAGFAFCVTDDPDEEDVYIPAAAVRPGMHGDRVLVRREQARRRGRSEGRIVKVLARGTTRVVGVYRRGRTAGVVVPQEQRITVPIVVPRGDEGGAADGDMVVATIVRHPSLSTEAEARVTDVLGPAADPRVETEAVIAAHDLPREFPPEVLAAACRVPAAVPPAALAGRLDLRALPIVTIDGENARDFDDAVLVEPDGTGFRLTVAVADVAHYVAAGSPLDLEARARGTSVYFPDRVLPMLPEELSNGICSLRPAEDRLVNVVRIAYDAHGRETGVTFHAGVIRSAARLTYTQVRQALVDRDTGVRAALGDLVAPLERAETLARLLMARRRKRGAIDFDLPEAEVILDLRGRPEQILRAERSIAHQMIEEFMLAANEAVARELTRRKLAFLHRVHEPPAADAVDELARFLEGFGLRLRRRNGVATPAAFAEVLRAAVGRPEERLVNTVLLRAMQQARYAVEPLGHFGLATDNYLHFTSPIRRYPDLVVHRLLRGERVPPDLVAIAEESSRRERVAMEAEREIVQLKKIQFMQERVGETHAGFVSGVTPFGAFVELADVFVEGLVHVSTLGDDFYDHLEREHALRGRRTGRRIRVGDAVRVTIAGVSVERRQIDFTLEGSAPSEGRERWRGRRRRS